MKLAVNGCQGRFWIYSGIKRTYLRKDGTLGEAFWGDNNDFWSFKSQQEAQQFLDYWMPQEKQLSIKQIKQAAELGEKTALNFSIEHWKQNVLDVKNAHLGGSYCAVCERAKAERDKAIGSWVNGSCCSYCILNDYRLSIYAINCCKEYQDFVDKKTEENAIAMLNKLVLIRNKKYGNRMYSNLYKGKTTTATIYDEYAGIMNEFLGENKMSKIVFDDGKEVELSKETTERLRKELVKPKVEWRHGDIALSHWFINKPKKRLILIEDGDIKLYDNRGDLMYRHYDQDYIKDKMEEYKYERIGNLFDDFSD